MKHQWPPGVTRAMHQFLDAAPVAPSLTSVYEQRPIPPSRRPRRAHVESEQQLVQVKENYVSVDSPPTSEVRNRRRIAMAAAAVVVVIGVAAIAINSMNSDDDVEPAPAVQPTVAPTTVAPTSTVAPTTKTVSFTVTSANIPVTFTVPDDWIVFGGWTAYKPDTVGVIVDDISNIYVDGPSAVEYTKTTGVLFPAPRMSVVTRRLSPKKISADPGSTFNTLTRDGD